MRKVDQIESVQVVLIKIYECSTNNIGLQHFHIKSLNQGKLRTSMGCEQLEVLKNALLSFQALKPDEQKENLIGIEMGLSCLLSLHSNFNWINFYCFYNMILLWGLFSLILTHIHDRW